METPNQPPLRAHFRSKFRDPSWMLRDVGQCIRTIAPWDATICDEPVTSDTEIEVLCTYSWSTRGSEKTNPLLYVPGFPPKWSPPVLPMQLPADDRRRMVDAHAHLAPTYPFEPTFQAMKVMNHGVNLNDVDIIVNRNSLTGLLDFVSGRRTHQFYLHLHLIGNTLILGRKEKNTAAGPSGFGHSFEDHFTSTPEATADTYHRVIRYRFGDLNLVIRHEVDAYCDSGPTLQESFNGTDIPIHPHSTVQLPILHSLATAVIPRGTRIPQCQMAELKTSGKGASIRQCWFGQTPNLCIAKHKEGLVTSADMKNVWSQCVVWEKAQQHNLRRLAGLLGQMRHVMKGMKSGRGVLVRMEREAPLQIYEGNDKMRDALPELVTSVFWQ